jgi:hypothetical protein
MALSDSCFEFLEAVQEAASKLAEEAHHYSAPAFVSTYGTEVDALRRAAAIVAEHPYDHEAGSRLIRLAVKIGKYHDTVPGHPAEAENKKEMLELVRLLQSELTGEDVDAVPAVVENIVTESRYTEPATIRLKAMLGKLGKSSYDVAIKIIGDVGSSVAKRMLGM